MTAFELAVLDARKRRKACDALAASTPRALLIRVKGGGSVLIHPCCRVRGNWRATRFDATTEPTGHSECVSFADAIREAHACDILDYESATEVSASSF